MALDHLLENNRRWVAEMFDPGSEANPQRSPAYLWIGCCDGPFGVANRLGLEPGDLLIHRNLGNIVSERDPSCLAAVQFGVDVLQVGDIIVCGHSGCRAVRATLSDEPLEWLDHWLVEIDEAERLHNRHVDDAGDGQLVYRPG